MTNDFTLWYDGGTIALLFPVSDDAVAWADAHLPEDAPGVGNAVAVEPRYLPDIITGICSDGLAVRAA